MKQHGIGLIIFSLLSFGAGPANAGVTEEWLGKAANAAGAAARGDGNGAAQSLLPSANWQAQGSQFYANSGGAGVTRPLSPLNRVSNPYVNVSGAYGAGTQGLSRPRPSAQVSVSNPYFQNTATLRKQS